MKTKNILAEIITKTMVSLTFTLATVITTVSYGQNVSTASVYDFESKAIKSYKLTSFVVRCIEGRAYAQWTVKESTNECLYLLEGSQDNKQYNLLSTKQGIISPMGQELLHCYIDKNPFKGVSYYRIRRFSKEGCIVSETVKINNDASFTAITSDTSMK